MKIEFRVFFVAAPELKYYRGTFQTYEEAEKFINENHTGGAYCIEKVFIK